MSENLTVIKVLMMLSVYKHNSSCPSLLAGNRIQESSHISVKICKNNRQITPFIKISVAWFHDKIKQSIFGSQVWCYILSNYMLKFVLKCVRSVDFFFFCFCLHAVIRTVWRYLHGFSDLRVHCRHMVRLSPCVKTTQSVAMCSDCCAGLDL